MPNIGVMQVFLARLLGVDLVAIPAPIQLVGMMLDVAIITAVACVVWNGLMLIGRAIADTLEVTGVQHRLVIARGLTRHDFDQVRKSIRGWRLMVVRYGTDDYLRALAGEADRHIGRPRHSSSDMRLSLSASGEAILRWKLPVHRRLGTQFRCYVVTRKGDGGLSVLADILKHYDEIEVLQPDLPERRHVYFLLAHFQIVTTAEGARNNYVAPE
jgi:hypothetical protein